MRYLSVCSGMEAASVAWHPLSWTPVGFSEIEPFPCAILKHRFPKTPNYGSLTEHASWPLQPGSIDLLVGGTPCQSFSVAGLRKGLADPRGNLALTFLALADRLKPKWIIWENVPGVLSSGGGRDFGSFLGALVELGYGFAYRVLDAQHFGVPQRRRRVFVVACLGDWRAPAEVLSLREGLRGYLASGGKKRKGPASDAGSGVEAGVECATGKRTYALTASQKGATEDGTGRGTPIINHPEGCWWDGGQVSQTLDAVLQKGQTMPEKNRFPAVLQPVCATGERTHCLTKSHHGSEDGTGRGTPIVIDRAAFNQGENAQYEPHIEQTEVMDSLVARGPHGVAIPIQDGREMEKNQNGMGVGNPGDPAYTIDTTGAQAAAIPFRKSKRAASTTDNETWVEADSSNTLNNFDLGDTRTTHAVVACSDVSPHIATAMAVRRLTPVECERLQGFPDNWSRIPWKGKPETECPDGPRYKACGNSMAVPVMRWIGERIAAVESSSHA